MTTAVPGLYVNHLGAEMEVLTWKDTQERYRIETLGGACLAVAHDSLFGDQLWLVTAESLADAGYVRPTEEASS